MNLPCLIFLLLTGCAPTAGLVTPNAADLEALSPGLVGYRSPDGHEEVWCGWVPGQISLKAECMARAERQGWQRVTP